jgi:ketosteroid isomerase-like protein
MIVKSWLRPSLLAAALLMMAGPAFAADPAPVAAAEQAFAKSVAELGIRDGFLAHMADDAIVFAPGPVSAKALYGGRPPSKPASQGGTQLVWWPTFAGLAASGDLGFTTGPAEVNGQRISHYFTVWKRQPDGAWKWIYDGGVSNDASGEPAMGAPVRPLPAGSAAKDPAKAFAEVQALETAFAQAAKADVAMAYRAALAADAQVEGSPAKPATTPKAVETEIATRAVRETFTPLGGAASAAGDLAWTYGAAAADGSKHYVRIWRHGPDGWRIVYDQVL